MNSPKNIVVKPSLKDEDGARAYYTQSAGTYDLRTGYETTHHVEAIRLAAIREGEHVLEVACGTGRATVELAKLVGTTGRLNAIDLTREMIEKAEAKIRAHHLSDRVIFETGSALQLPYPDQTFDVLYNSYMFDLIPQEHFPKVLTEFMRVLQPGGRLVLVNMSKNTPVKTLYEAAYERGWMGACRPVMMTNDLQAAGFCSVVRLYRGNNIGFVPLPFGTEIVTARKSDTTRIPSSEGAKVSQTMCENEHAPISSVIRWAFQQASCPTGAIF